nr:Protein LET-805, isoform b [Haemonchus contortus]
MKGYKDANKLGSASAARRRMDDDYGSRDDRFHEGYVKGLKDAGMTGMSTSMHNLAQKGPGGGYSSGFMQGYKDGNSGIFGDRVTPSLISRLDEQYPGQDDFKQGYVDGFKEGAGSRTGERRTFEDSRRLQQSLTELTERLTSLEKTKGDEIHSTKIYHVYNQQPDSIAYTSSAQQLAHELEEINSTSRRSTLRRHYTPGDYLKQASEGEGYGTLGRNRRSLSASALARDRSTPRGYTSDTGNAYDTVRSKARGYSNYDYDTFSSSRHHETRSSAVGGGGGTTGFTTVPTTRYSAKDSTDDAGRWADDLLEIVSEPMNKTLDRMKKYSSSSANVEGGASTSHGDAKEIVEEKYHRSYKEEHSSGAGR